MTFALHILSSVSKNTYHLAGSCFYIRHDQYLAAGQHDLSSITVTDEDITNVMFTLHLNQEKNEILVHPIDAGSERNKPFFNEKNAIGILSYAHNLLQAKPNTPFVIEPTRGPKALKQSELEKMLEDNRVLCDSIAKINTQNQANQQHFTI